MNGIEASKQLTISNDSRPSFATTVQALADSGAQSDVSSLDDYLRAGFSIHKLNLVRLALNTANKSSIHISGRTQSGTTLNKINDLCQ